MINRRNVFLTALLITTDQSVNIIIFTKYMGRKFVLIPNIFLFKPVQNIHMNYLGSLLGEKKPLLAIIIFSIIGLV